MPRDKAATERIKFINEARDKLEKEVSVLQKKLYDRILDRVILKLDASGGVIKDSNGNIDISNAINRIFKTFNDTKVAGLVNSFAGDLNKILELNTDYFKAIETEKKKIADISTEVEKTMNKRIGLAEDGKAIEGGYLDRLITDDSLKKEAQALTLKSITSGESLSSFKDSMSELIEGTDAIDGGLQRHFNTFAYDTYQQFDRATSDQWAKKLGLKAFIYNGGQIKTSRDFCIERDGKVYTFDEAQEWKKLKWDGKNTPYNPVHDLGGYNCRHQADWITDDLAKTLRPDLEDVL